MRRSRRKMGAIVLACVMLATAVGCAGTAGSKDPWLNSNLEENIPLMAETELKDDFASAVNYEWASEQTYDSSVGCGTMAELREIIRNRKRAILDDTRVTNKNLELLRTVDDIYSDWEYRKELGITPLTTYLSYIDSIETPEDLTAYILDEEKNPYAYSLLSFETVCSPMAEDYLALQITKPELSLEEYDYYGCMDEEGLHKQERVKTLVEYLYDRCGYTKKEADALLEDCLRFETDIVYAGHMGKEEWDETRLYTYDDIVQTSHCYPMKELLDQYGFTDTKHFIGDFYYMRFLDSLYTADNLSRIKAYFKVNLILDSAYLLDRDALLFTHDNSLDRLNPYAENVDYEDDTYFFSYIGSNVLCAAMDAEYLAVYCDEQEYQDLLAITERVKEQYYDIIDSKEWLSDVNKQHIKDKLDAVTMRIIYPSNEADFNDMTLRTKEEGGNLLEIEAKMNHCMIHHHADMTKLAYDRSFWDAYNPDTSTTTTNSCYVARQNCFFINAGILGGSIYQYDASYEEKLAGLGTIIGHELSHAFDSRGVFYDATGKYSDIIEGDDMEVFSDKSGKVSSFYTKFRPFENSGTYGDFSDVAEEVIADMGGVRCCLDIAAEETDFDYDTFFRSYARLWRRIETKNDQVQRIKEDPHPLAYLRINVTLQQFEEFYETYDIAPGDGMYLAPEERIAIW